MCYAKTWKHIMKTLNSFTYDSRKQLRGTKLAKSSRYSISRTRGKNIPKTYVDGDPLIITRCHSA